jgi:hypothetical protein
MKFWSAFRAGTETSGAYAKGGGLSLSLARRIGTVVLFDAGKGAGGSAEEGECRTACKDCEEFVFVGTLVLLALLNGGGAVAVV